MKRSCDDFFAKDGILCAKVDACNADGTCNADGAGAHVAYTNVKNLQIANKTAPFFDANNFANETLYIVKIAKACIGAQDIFDEAFLAKLRDKLKSLEVDTVATQSTCGNAQNGAQVPAQNGANALFAIEVELATLSITNAEDATEIIYHTMRRIKDCKNVCGVVMPLPCTLDFAQNLILRLAKKHPEYVYFVQDSLQNPTQDASCKDGANLYGALCEQFAGRIVCL